MNKKIYMVFFIIMLSIIASGCGTETSNYSPDQVINNALDEKEAVGSYYAEGVMKLYENDELTLNGEIKEWRFDDGRARVESNNIIKADGEDTNSESIAVNDGEVITIYDSVTNQVMTTDDPELLSTETSSPKEQADLMLDMVKDTHDIKLEGEEEMLGREVYHIAAKANESDTLLGDQELFVDKENWIVLKSISHSGDTKVEAYYTLFEEDVSEEESLFHIDVPGDAEYIELDDVSNTEEISLEEATDIFADSFFYFAETDELTIDQIQMTTLMDEDHKELEIDYILDGSPYMTLSVVENEVELDEEGEDLLFSGEDEVTIREQKGIQMDMDSIRMINWQEDGKRYTITLINPDITFEEIIEEADDMKLLK